VNSAGPQWDSNKFNGRARRRAGEARRPSLGEQVVGVVGEVRPDRPVYVAGEIRERLLPPSCGDARCRWDRRGTVCAPQRSLARSRARARRMEAAKGKTRGFKKWTVILACGLYRILELKHLPRRECAQACTRTAWENTAESERIECLPVENRVYRG